MYWGWCMLGNYRVLEDGVLWELVCVGEIVYVWDFLCVLDCFMLRTVVCRGMVCVRGWCVLGAGVC